MVEKKILKGAPPGGGGKKTPLFPPGEKNPRWPSACKADALPAELIPHSLFYILLCSKVYNNQT